MRTHINRFVILLRGVMPTGRNRVPMAQFRAALSDAGLEAVQTYIQSGNVIADSDLDAARVEHLVHATIRERIGAEIVVIARTAEEFRRILANNPFADADSSKVYFTLFQMHPAPERLQALLSIDCSPDAIRVTDDALYTCYATKHSDSPFTTTISKAG